MGETDDQGEMPGTITTHEYVVCSRRRSPCKLGRMRHLAFIALVTIDQVVDQTNYLRGDHLGGTNVTANGTNGAELGRVLYRPWGETRLSSGSTPTTWRFTGQREDATIGLYFYNARYLDPQLGRFVQPDIIVPNPGDPQSLNRYSYVLNNALRYTDPTGMFSEDAI